MADKAPAPDSSGRPGVALEWRDLRFEVPVKPAKGGGPTSKRILSDISGKATPGTMTLLMGPSGAGKTSLLKMLSRRTKATSGSMLVNGEAPTSSFRRIHGFVEQDVAMFDTLTVFEVLTTTARLKLPASVKRPELERRVDAVIDSLDIRKVKDNQVGKCSGGEKRRLAVAAELLGEPSLLFLDEPTSGLDGTSALNVMTILRRLAKEQHRTIICTIHQPRASLLPLADQLILLADGRQVYGGPTWTAGRRDGMLGYFAGLGFPSPSFENPADFMVDLVNDKVGDGDGGDAEAEGADAGAAAGAEGADAEAAEADADIVLEARAAAAAAAAAARESDAGLDARGWDEGSEGASLAALPAKARVVDAATLRASKSRSEFVRWLADAFLASDARRRATAALGPSDMPGDPLAEAAGGGGGRYPTSFWTQTSVVFRRVALFKIREPEAVATLFSGVVVVALIVGLVYLQLPVTTQGLIDRFGFLSLFSISVGFAPIDLVLLFPKERAVFLRDSAQNLYGTLAFYCGRTLADLPFQLGFSAIAAILGYFMVGFQVDGLKLVVFILAVMAVMWCTAGLFMAVSSVSPDVASANGIVTLVLIFAMLFSGTFIAAENTPVIFRWIADISYIRFAIEAPMIAEMRGLTIDCSPEQLALGCVTTGEQYLQRIGYGTTEAQMWAAIGWITLQGLVFRVLACIFLHFAYTGQSVAERLRLACEW